MHRFASDDTLHLQSVTKGAKPCTDFPIKNLLTAEKHGDSDRPSGFDPLSLAGRCHASDSWYRYVCVLDALRNPPRMHT